MGLYVINIYEFLCNHDNQSIFFFMFLIRIIIFLLQFIIPKSCRIEKPLNLTCVHISYWFTCFRSFPFPTRSYSKRIKEGVWGCRWWFPFIRLHQIPFWVVEKPLLHMLQRRVHRLVSAKTFQPPDPTAANPMVTSGGTVHILPFIL